MEQLIEPKLQSGMWKYIEVLNNNKYFVGVIMILLNLGSKYISIELSQSQEKFLGSPIIRRLILFTVFFTATRDIWISFLLTAAFVILVGGVFNDKSNYCLIPQKYRYSNETGGEITEKDIEKAKEIIELSKKKNENKNNDKDIIEKFKQKRNIYNNNMNKFILYEKFKSTMNN